MKEMVYDAAGRTEILASGEIDGYPYLIISLGTHPCAYVGVPEGHPYYGLDYTEPDVACHGGLTYGGAAPRAAELPDDLHHWFGWDYAHWCDYITYLPDSFSHRYTTAEILEDVRHVIPQLTDAAK